MNKNLSFKILYGEILMNKMIGVLATTLISAGLSFSALADKVTLKFHTMVPMLSLIHI